MNNCEQKNCHEKITGCQVNEKNIWNSLSEKNLLLRRHSVFPTSLPGPALAKYCICPSAGGNRVQYSRHYQHQPHA